VDVSDIKEAYEAAFSSQPIIFKFDTKEYPIEYVSIEDDLWKFKTNLKDRPSHRTVSFHQTGKRYEVRCKLVSSDHVFELLEPGEAEVATSERKEDRLSTRGKNFKVATFTSLLEIGDVVKLNQRPIGAMKDAIAAQLGEKFGRAKIHIHSGGGINKRLEIFLKTPKVIFFNRGRENEAQGVEFFPAAEFARKVFESDRSLGDEFISEITVPIFYKGQLPFGYIQVNGASELTKDVLRSIKRLAINLEYKIRKLAAWEVKLDGDVLDISPGGMSFEFSNRDYAKHFHMDKQVFLNITLGTGEKALATALVRHKDFISGKNWIGVSLENLDPISEVALEEAIAGSKA